MNQQQNNVVTINLSELWYVFLYHWKKVVLWALIGLLVGGGAAVLKYRRSASKYADYQAQEKQYEDQKSQYEKLLDNKKKALADYMDYYNNSILMQIDPQNVQRSYGTASVNPADGISMSDAVNTLKNQLLTDDVLNQLAKENNTKADYIKELVTVGTDDDGNLTVTVKGNTADLTKKIYDTLQKRAKTVSDTNAASFTCSLPGPTNDSYSDDDLASKQSDYSTQISDANTAVTNAQSSLDGLKAPEQPDSRSKMLTKYGAIGLILGLLIAFAGYTVDYVRKQHVYNPSDLYDYFKVKNLGSYDQSKLYEYKNYGLKGFARRKLGFVTGEDLGYTSTMVATNLYNFTKSGARNLVLIGDGTQVDGINKVLHDISDELKGINDDYRLIYAKNILTSATSRRVLGSADAAVLLVNKGATSQKSVREELRLLDEMQISCVGSILL